MKVRWLSREEVKSLLTMTDVMDSVEDAFLQHSLQNVQMPPKIYLDFLKYGGDLRAMPAYLEKQDIGGVKIVNVHPNNPNKGLPTVMAVLIINDPSTGAPLAIMDATYLTDLRTGASGGIAVKHLAKKNSEIVGMVGTGRQARTQLSAINRIIDVNEVKVTSNSKEDDEKFIEEMKSEVNSEYRICDLEETCKCDILVTTTPVKQPIIKSAWILEGTHINAIGADAKGKEELDPMILKNGKIVVDDMTQSSHSGEINVPLSKGILEPKDIYAELGNIIEGKIPGRTNSNEITIFDSTGLAIQDIATGFLVYTKAVNNNVGTVLSLF
tara:strand:+ start:4276 stop:5253 length:978 start_codon:yes stop_codon:yes gene_type:complete